MPSIVFVPAMGCDSRLYAEIVSRLSGISTSTIVCDRPRISDCVAQVLEAAPETFIIMGTSFGGRVALETAIAMPERVMGLIVAGAGSKPVADPAAGKRRVARMRGGEFAAVVTEMGDMVAHLPGPLGPQTRDAFIAMAHELGARRMANQAEAMATRGDVSARLAEISCPALMLWGREDLFSPAADGMAVAACMPHTRFVEITDCGHFPSLEAPQESAAIIQHWLDEYF
jgi:pimeloyl-ACP methyl ester carboxylesterase